VQALACTLSQEALLAKKTNKPAMPDINYVIAPDGLVTRVYSNPNSSLKAAIARTVATLKER
jgi:hypothetical protein